MTNIQLRTRVLQLYKKVIKYSQTWTSIDNPTKTKQEQIYIRDEARTLFRQNKNVKDEQEIEQHLFECQSRMDLASHYRIPYPRPVSINVNLPTYSLAPSQNRIRYKSEYEIEQISRPIYLKSYDKQEENDVQSSN